MNVCVPVLKRYDLLRRLVQSLKTSTVPVELWVLDNGLRQEALDAALEIEGIKFYRKTPVRALGVAESWNWFLQHVPGPWLIANDDVAFSPDTVEKFLAADADIVFSEHGFSCFLMRQGCVDKIGLFDETISPGYAYYEDEDYLQRIDRRGTRERSCSMLTINAGVMHQRSSTLMAATPEELEEHHRKFKIAQGNYVRKWGLEEAFERERLQREMAGAK